jgi:hypothetical protein
VDPDEPLAEVTLAYKLMNRFVRREKKQSEPSTNPGTRFATNELILLMVAVARAKEHLVNNGKNVSVRAIARCLRGPRLLGRHLLVSRIHSGDLVETGKQGQRHPATSI